MMNVSENKCYFFNNLLYLSFIILINLFVTLLGNMSPLAMDISLLACSTACHLNSVLITAIPVAINANFVL